MKSSLKADLQAAADPIKAAFFPRFFKTGKGEYGEGDVFLGVTVPQTRAIVKNHRGMSLRDIETLLKDPIHECRLAALFLLVHRYQKGDEQVKKETFDFYLSHLKYVNNWDLVDSSAYQIVGAHLLDRNRGFLLNLAKSKHFWTQRIAIVSTFAFIRQKQFDDTLRIAEILLTHKHDLIHKAVGWMLRETGKKDEEVLKRFLDQHAKKMPRTMLRYAIERLEASERVMYMER